MEVCACLQVLNLKKYYLRSYACGLVSRGLLLFLLQVEISTFTEVKNVSTCYSPA